MISVWLAVDLFKSNLMFPFFLFFWSLCYLGSVLLWVVFKLQGMSHQCVSVFFSIHFPPERPGQPLATIKSESTPDLFPLPFCWSRGEKAGMSNVAAACCLCPCVFAQDPLHSWKSDKRVSGMAGCSEMRPFLVWKGGGGWNPRVSGHLLASQTPPSFLASFFTSDLIFICQ